MKQVTMLEMIDHLEKTIDLLKDAVRQTETVSAPEAADEPEAEAVMCGTVNDTEYCAIPCAKPFRHEGQHEGSCGCKWSNETEAVPEPAPKPEGMTVAELIRELGAMPDKNATVRISNPFGNNFCVQEIGQNYEGGYVWVRDRISVNEN